jgi:translocator protein
MNRRRGPNEPRSRLASLGGLLGFAVAVAIVALVGALGSAGAGEEYDALDQPGWAPPGWLFSPVWTALYVTIAIAGWLVWRVTGLHRVLLPYAIQLILNAAWPVLFFTAGAYGLAAIEVGLLWLAIGVTVLAFWRVHRAAALLLIPYWAWTTYATALTIAIWWLNR